MHGKCLPGQEDPRRRAGIDDRVVHQVLAVPEELRAEMDLAVDIPLVPRLRGLDSPVGWASATISGAVDRPRV
ncbi:hypothetical protein [Actinokineospora diospyrosa]|uniref:hypothetical protein n=1 Tax=Actinokineospora diospyrosa TaxID=103728 RepID=UPI0020A4F1BB|nr:hypothetical protein [Actinokineospora diospyrosa]